MSGKNFKEGDRTNFRVYDSIESYRTQNLDANPIYSAFIESAINRNGFIVYLESITGSNGENISHLKYEVERPKYVFGPNFKLGDSPRDKERGLAVAKFIREGEAAHDVTKNSKLVFRRAVC